MKNLRFIGLLVTVVLLAFGLTVACDNGTTKDETTEVGSRYTGTTPGGESVEVIFSNKAIDSAKARAAGPNNGDFYLIKVGGADRSSGTIQLSGSNITFIPDDGTPPFTGSIANDVLTISGTSIGGVPLNVQATDPNTGTSPGAGGPSVQPPVGVVTVPTDKGNVQIPPKSTPPIDSVSDVVAALGGASVARASADLKSVELIGPASITKPLNINVPIVVASPSAALTIAKGVAVYYTFANDDPDIGINIGANNALTLYGPGALVVETLLEVADDAKLRVVDGQLVVRGEEASIYVDGLMEVIPANTASNPVVLLDGGSLVIDDSGPGQLTVTSAEVFVKGNSGGEAGLGVMDGATLLMTNAKLTIGDLESPGLVYIADADATLSKIDIVNGYFMLGTDTTGAKFADVVNVGTSTKDTLFAIGADGEANFNLGSALNVNNKGTLLVGSEVLTGTAAVNLNANAVLTVNRGGKAIIGAGNGTDTGTVTVEDAPTTAANSSKIVVKDTGVLDLIDGTVNIGAKSPRTLPGLEINSEGVFNVGDETGEDVGLVFVDNALAKVNNGTLRFYNIDWKNDGSASVTNSGPITFTFPAGSTSADIPARIEFSNGGTFLLPAAFLEAAHAGILRFYKDGQLIEVTNNLDNGTGLNGFWYPLIGNANTRGGTIGGRIDLYEYIAAGNTTAGLAVGAEYIVESGYLDVVGDATYVYAYTLNDKGSATIYGVRNGASATTGSSATTASAVSGLILPEIGVFTISAGSTLTSDVPAETSRTTSTNNQAGPFVTGTLTVEGTLVVPSGRTLRAYADTGDGEIAVSAGGVVNNLGTIRLGTAVVNDVGALIVTGKPVEITAAAEGKLTTVVAATPLAAGTVNNTATATGTGIIFANGSSVLTNAGILNTGNISIATGISGLAAAFANSGTINVTSGTVNLTAGGLILDNDQSPVGKVNVNGGSISVIANSVKGGAIQVYNSNITSTVTGLTESQWLTASGTVSNVVLPSGSLATGQWPGKAP